MKNVVKTTINELAKEARNLDLNYNDQMAVVKIIKAIAAGDNALAFALLITNENLRPLVGVWSSATASLDKPNKIKLTREQFIAKIAKAIRQLDLNRDEQIIAINALKAVCAGDKLTAYVLLKTNEKLHPLMWTWNIVDRNGGIRQ